jgi:predicted MFS family arabinose efflux permease
MFGNYKNHFLNLSLNVKLFLIGNAVQGMGQSIYGLLFNLYLKELGYGESIIGTLVSTTSLGISIMAIPASLVIEKFHAKHLVVTGMLLSSFFYFLQILSIDQSSLFFWGLMASMFLAIFNISVSPFYLRNSTPEQRVHLFSLNSGLNIMAHLFGYLIGGYLPKIVKWFEPGLSQLELYRSAIMLALMVMFLSNLIFIRIRRVPIPETKNNLLQGLKEKEWKMLFKLVLPKLYLAFGGGMVVPFINLYLKDKFHLSTDMIGVSYALLQFFIFVGIFLTPTLVAKTTHLKFIITTAILSIPFMVTMGLAENVTVVLSCFFLRGMLMNMSGPIMSMFEMEHVRESECAFASSVIMFSYHLVYTTSTRMGGVLIEKTSFGPTFYIAGGSYLLAIILYHRFFHNEDLTKRKVTQEKTLVRVS